LKYKKRACEDMNFISTSQTLLVIIFVDSRLEYFDNQTSFI